MYVLPELQEGDILIMDNCAFHKGYMKEVLNSLLESVGAKLIFLPPYSPELSPAEKVFGKMKGILKNKTSDCIPLAIMEALQKVDMKDMFAFYKNCYYF